MTVSRSICPGTSQGGARPKGLPIGELLAFTVAGFLVIMTENMPAGLLLPIGASLGVSEAMAGQVVTAYALGCVVAAIPVITATQSWNRRRLMLVAIGGLMVLNALTSSFTNFGLTLVVRFIAGMAAGIIHSLLAVYARRLAPPRLQGRALAIVGVGQPIALSLGVPLGSWLGGMFGWRAVFWIMSVVALALLFWVRFGVRDLAGQRQRQRLPTRNVVLIPGVASVLVVLFAWILAHNILYTYVASFLSAISVGLRLEVILFVFGASSVVGVWITGIAVDQRLRSAVITSLVAFVGATLLLALNHHVSAPVLVGVAAWGLTFGGAPTLLQTALADAAGDHADVAQSFLVTVFNLAVAGGGLAGGVIVSSVGAALLPWMLLPLVVFALVAAWRAKAHGFPNGRRQTIVQA